jgi:hypothetical protein
LLRGSFVTRECRTAGSGQKTEAGLDNLNVFEQSQTLKLAGGRRFDKLNKTGPQAMPGRPQNQSQRRSGLAFAGSGK